MANEDFSQVILKWSTLDAQAHERSASWYFAGTIFIIGFAAYGLFTASWTTTILAILIGGIYFMLRNAKPRRIDVQITGMGVRVEDKFVPWNMCRDFWILIPTTKSGDTPEKEKPELHISPQRFPQREISVFIDEIDPAEVREVLLQFLPERAGMQERFLDIVARLLKL